MYLMNWIPLEAQRTVMAHELTHALQDQNYDLSKFEKHESGSANPSGGASMSVSGTDEDEHDLAQSAVIEGQAMVVFVDYGLRAANVTLASSPDAQDIASNILRELRSAGKTSQRAPRADGKHNVSLSPRACF